MGAVTGSLFKLSTMDYRKRLFDLKIDIIDLICDKTEKGAKLQSDFIAYMPDEYNEEQIERCDFIKILPTLRSAIRLDSKAIRLTEFTIEELINLNDLIK